MRRTVALMMALGFTAGIAQAGPPLICHPMDIGDAVSLPGQGSDWRVYKSEYDVRGLVDDTLALLRPSTPVLVRMETIRRATVHGKKDPAALVELLGRLESRASEDGARGVADALALFDLGYFVEALEQFRWELRNRAIDTGVDGYATVERAIELAGGDPEMEFAAALISLAPERPRHERHLTAAIEGARDGSLLAKNLIRHFSHRGATLAELRAMARRD